MRRRNYSRLVFSINECNILQLFFEVKDEQKEKIRCFIVLLMKYRFAIEQNDELRLSFAL